ncbi:MAG: alpha/beta fold hydrolase [Pseudomonadota bacterium]
MNKQSFHFSESIDAEEALRLLSRMHFPASSSDPSVGEGDSTDDQEKKSADNVASEPFEVRVQDDLRDLVIKVLKIDAADITPKTPLMNLGLDSIAATEIGTIFTRDFGITVPPTVFFEFQDLEGFVGYLVSHHRAELAKKYGTESPRSAAASAAALSAAAIRTKPAQPQSDSLDGSSVNLSEAPKSGAAPVGASSTPAGMSAANQPSLNDLWNSLAAAGSSTTDAKLPAKESQDQDPGASSEELRLAEPFVQRVKMVTARRKDGGTVEGAVLGEGPPLLLIGGLVMHYSVMWRLQLEQLSARYRLIMLHAPGCGGSSTYEGMTLESLSADIATLLDTLGINAPLPVVGYSFGGVLTQAFALAFPWRVSAICVAVTTPISEGANNFPALMRDLRKSARFMELNRNWPITALPAYRGIIQTFDFRPELKQLDMPALVIAATEDEYMPPSLTRMIAEALPKARFVEVPFAGHLIGFTHHEDYNRMVLTFLDEVEASACPAAMSTEPVSASGFLPASPATLSALADYVVRGEQGHCAILSEASAEAAIRLNSFCAAGKNDGAEFNCYFMTSAEEAADAAVRLARHAARNVRPASSGAVLIIESEGRWQRYFDPLSAGTKDALVPGMHFVRTFAEATAQEVTFGLEGLTAVVYVHNGKTQAADFDAWLAVDHGVALTVVIDAADPSRGLDQSIIRRSKHSPDLIVLGEGISGYQAPIGACLVNKRIRNPWMMTPSESYVRHVMTNFGAPLRITCEYLASHAAETLSAANRQEVEKLKGNPQRTYETHLKYGNAGYAKVAHLHGFDARFYEARNMTSRLSFDGRNSREITDCFVNVGTAPRGLNPLDVADSVVPAHKSGRDYWQELGNLVGARVRLSRCYPASSNVTAVEAALTLGLLAAPRRKLLCFTGGLGFTLLSAASSFDKVFDIFRKPFLPIYEHAVFIDPAASDAAARLAAELQSGTIGLVWFETIQVDANASRPLPPHLIDLINRHRKVGGYLVGVDETQTNLVTGRFLHSEGIVERPDIVALGTALCDSLFPAGMVLASDNVHAAALRTNATRVTELENRSRNQLVAHVALNSLEDIFSRHLMEQAKASGAELIAGLQRIADEFPLIREVRGEAHLVTIELDLAGYDPFLQRSFGYLLWGAMLRDPMHGVAAAVCPIHNNCLRFLAPLTMTRSDRERILKNVRRAMMAGVADIVRNCADHAASHGDERTAGFLNGLAVAADQVPQRSSANKAFSGGNVPMPTADIATIPPNGRFTLAAVQYGGGQRRLKVCIVGAGVGGISMAKQLKQRGIQFDCFDPRDRIGGVWAYDESGKHTSVWYNLNMNTPRGLYQFSDFPMPKSYPDFPSHRQVYEYLESYIEHFGIRDNFNLNTAVQKADRLADGAWRVHLSTGEIRTYDALVIANGHHNDPNLPAYADLSQGNAIHSKHYRRRHDYMDQTVMVVGVGNSGSQIAVDVSLDAKMTYLSIRRGVYVLPHYLFGIRTDKVMWQLNSWWVKKALPYPLHGLLFTGLYNLLIAKRSQMGMPKPDHLMMSSLPTLSENFANRIGDGKLKIVPQVRRIDGRKVEFVDGTSITVDKIIYATGYKTDFPFLDPKVMKVEDNRIPLYLRIFCPEVSNLMFIGLFQAVTWGFLDMMERQSIVAAEYLAGTYHLPSVQEQRADIESDRRTVEKEFLATLRNNYEMHGPTYMHKLTLELRNGAKRAKAAGFTEPVKPQAATQVAANVL